MTSDEILGLEGRELDSELPDGWFMPPEEKQQLLTEEQRDLLAMEIANEFGHEELCKARPLVVEVLQLQGRIAELEAEVERLRADGEHELMMAFVDGAKWWEWKTTKFTMWQSDQNEAAEAWKEKRARTQRDAARKEPT